jgi:RNA polymerase sigma-70 factor (ECF subfamily)
MADRAEIVQGIVRDLQAGTAVEERFRQLCDLFHRPLYHFFARRGFPPQDCLDLTQETFLGIFRGIGSFRRDARFETWLFKVAANAYRKRLRAGVAEKRAGQEVPLEVPGDEGERRDLPTAGGPAPGEELLSEERSRVLRAAIERLPEQMRKCLMLRVYHEMKYREIGVVMRLSPETVKIHLTQARRRLQQELGAYFAEALSRLEEGPA